MSKIIKVSTDLEVTVHDFPQGTIREQNRQLCELIGNGCEMIVTSRKGRVSRNAKNKVVIIPRVLSRPARGV